MSRLTLQRIQQEECCHARDTPLDSSSLSQRWSSGTNVLLGLHLGHNHIFPEKRDRVVRWFTSSQRYYQIHTCFLFLSHYERPIGTESPIQNFCPESRYNPASYQKYLRATMHVFIQRFVEHVDFFIRTKIEVFEKAFIFRRVRS